MSILKVKLVAHTPNPEAVVASAAKLCYSAVGIDEITNNLTEESVSKFVNMLAGLGHQSPFEHVSFTFAVEGVSRTLTHQLVRHRMASYSQQSQRYVKLAQFEYIIPPTIEKNAEAKALFLKTMEMDQIAYDELIEILQQEEYDREIAYYIANNENITNRDDVPVKNLVEFWEKSGKKVIEDARYVFPNACETKIVITMNARELMHFFHERCCLRAQWEIRDLAFQMLILAKEIAPNIFKKSGPGCVYGICPEERMSCGQLYSVRKKFQSM